MRHRIATCLRLMPVFSALLAISASAEDPKVLEDPATANEPSVEAWKPDIPRTWDDELLATFELPLADGDVQLKHMSSEHYYQIPAQTIYKSYPVYHPDHEPEGYFEKLLETEPEVAFDPEKLKTKEDWIAAGEIVFDAALVYNALNKLETVRDLEWYQATDMPVAADGTVPFFRYFIEKKGTVYVGEFSCGACHTRVMPDGQVIKGAQGNYPLSLLDAMALKRRAERAEDKEEFLKRIQRATISPYGAPWMGENDPTARYSKLSIEESIRADGAIPPGVQARFGTSAFHPAQVPDLIGIEERRYLDRTGHVRHRSIGDLMRYAALQQGMQFFSTYGDFMPAGRLPEDLSQMERYSEEQLYALGLFLYSLKPPENPHAFDAQAERGKKVFQKEQCWRCHKPPLYTSNRLSPVEGYEPPPDHPVIDDIIPLSVGTDPGLALYTRRGTGLYKVPSLLGVWYRGPFGHSGSAATLEDWFDPKRRKDDYVPTGFKGLDETRAIPGHDFGLDLSSEDRAALIAFLKTL